MSFTNLTAVELGKKIKNKEVTVAQAVEACMNAIEKNETTVHSFVTEIGRASCRERV